MYNLTQQDKQWVNSVWEKLDKKLSGVAVRSRDKIPYTTIDGKHDNKDETDITWWTNGFWGGMMWLMYESTGNEEYRKTAENSELMLDNAFIEFDKLHHDVGFMWHITSGANYRLTGNVKSRVRNLYAASLLASRYNIDARFIRAWNGKWGGLDTSGFSIIDCLMNIPLLYWASKEINDDRFKKIAMKHADMALNDHIREDGSINHIVEHDTNSTQIIKVHTGQGYNEKSCWSRGLAWAVYGMIISYIHTKKEDYLKAAIKTADCFIKHCAKTNYRTVVDFYAPQEPAYYDSTAGVCTACGLLELSKYVSQEDGKRYFDAAIQILKETDKYFCNYDENEDSIVQMGTERYPLKSNKGLHIPIIYGDFFFVEAMAKLKGREFLIW